MSSGQQQSGNSIDSSGFASLKYQVPGTKSQSLLHETVWNLVLGRLLSYVIRPCDSLPRPAGLRGTLDSTASYEAVEIILDTESEQKVPYETPSPIRERDGVRGKTSTRRRLIEYFNSLSVLS